MFFFFFSSRRRHTRYIGDWSSDVCSSDLEPQVRLLRFGCRDEEGELAVLAQQLPVLEQLQADFQVAAARSEERRVGKECSSRWSTDELKRIENKSKRKLLLYITEQKRVGD